MTKKKTQSRGDNAFIEKVGKWTRDYLLPTTFCLEKKSFHFRNKNNHFLVGPLLVAHNLLKIHHRPQEIDVSYYYKLEGIINRCYSKEDYGL